MTASILFSGGAAAGTCLLLFIFRSWGRRILETVVSVLLTTFNSGVLRSGKQISGPRWEYPNGTVIERFANGRVNSEKWQKYGPVYRVWSGGHPEIVITTPEDLKHFSSDANNHPKTPNVNLGWFVGELLGQAMGLLYGQDWKRLRKIFDPAFTHSAAVSRIETVDEAARKYVTNLSLLSDSAPGEKLESSSSSSFTLPALKAFTKFPYFLTARAIYGPMTEREEQELWRITEQRLALNKYWIGGGFYRFQSSATLFDKDSVKSLREFQSDWKEYNRKMVEVRQVRGEHPPIMTYWEEVEAGNMSMTELLQTLDELLMLNLDVIVHVITWFITLIAEHDEVKRELCVEIASNRDTVLEYLAKTDTHLHRCFIESMRIRPFAVFTIGESSAAVKNFHGALVKPNTQILVDVLAINVRNPFWGDDSAEFKPSRLIGMKPSELRYNLHSFGIGSRKCMGQYVAGHIVKSLALHLFGSYEVEIVSPQKQGSGYIVDQSSWTPKADSLLQLTRKG